MLLLGVLTLYCKTERHANITYVPVALTAFRVICVKIYNRYQELIALMKHV
jgi:hypothetical protein